MVIVITGGSGMIAQALGQKLQSQNQSIHLLSRKENLKTDFPCRTFLWRDAGDPPPREAFPEKEKYGVIHLSGEPISKWPWTSSLKKKIQSSRVESAKNLVNTFKNIPAPSFFFSASATGIYGDQGEKLITETSPILDQNLFLQEVCKKWEEEALKASSVCRTVIFRLGIVMSYKKGFLYQQQRLLKKGFYPWILGRKKCWLSWIALEDLISMITWAIDKESVQGIYNATSPHPQTLKEFYKILARKNSEKNQLRSRFLPLPLPLPFFLMRWLGGEMTKNLLVACKAHPEKALSENFVFQKPKLKEALEN